MSMYIGIRDISICVFRRLMDHGQPEVGKTDKRCITCSIGKQHTESTDMGAGKMLELVQSKFVIQQDYHLYQAQGGKTDKRCITCSVGKQHKDSTNMGDGGVLELVHVKVCCLTRTHHYQMQGILCFLLIIFHKCHGYSFLSKR
jgi:hypothetical protein